MTKSYKLIAHTCFFLIISSHINDILIAQSTIQNHEKYWYYRARLKNDFLAGREILFSNSDKGEMQIDLRDFSKGIYSVKIISPDGFTEVKKIIYQ